MATENFYKQKQAGIGEFILFSDRNLDIQLGKKIKSARKISRYSQKKLADCIGVAFQTIQKYENGVMRVSAGRLVAIADALKIPIAFFFEGITSQRNYIDGNSNVVILSNETEAKANCINSILKMSEDDAMPLSLILDKYVKSTNQTTE